MERLATILAPPLIALALSACGAGSGPSAATLQPAGNRPPGATPVASRPVASRPATTAAGDAASQAATPPAPTKADEPNTTHGIYTEAQAARGRDVFAAICSECHAPDDWTQQAFLDRWEEASVYRLWYWIYERMPHGAPGSLTREQVTDALTYIFELNGLPPGDGELATDDDSIDDYWIIWR